MSCCRFILLKPPEHTEFTAVLLLKPIQIMPLVLQNVELNVKCPGQPASWDFCAHMFATGALFNTDSPPYCPTSSSHPVHSAAFPAVAIVPIWKARGKEPLQTPVSPASPGQGYVCVLHPSLAPHQASQGLGCRIQCWLDSQDCLLGRAVGTCIKYSVFCDQNRMYSHRISLVQTVQQRTLISFKNCYSK